MTDTLVLAVQNAPLLRQMGHGSPIVSLGALAAGSGRDKSNVSKSVKLMREAGWVAAGALQLTPAGAALLPGLASLDGTGEPATLTHAQLRPSPLNPRKDFTSETADEALDGLRASIVLDGLLQPLVVRREADANGVREIVAGESRWRAIGLAIDDGDLEPDFPIAVVYREISDLEHRRLALVENMVRRDLHVLEEAEAFEALEGTGLAKSEIAELVGRTPEYVQQRVRLLRLDAEQQDRMRLEPTDPHFLSFTGARNLLQGKAETGGSAQLAGMTLAQLVVAETPEAQAELESRTVAGLARPEPADPDQVDVEDLAPRRLELSAAQALILFEVQAAAKARPEGKQVLGPTTRVQGEPQPGKRGLDNETKLAVEGLLAFGTGYPRTVTLLRPGQVWLGGQPGAFMEDDFRLRHARLDVGLTSERIAELEDEESPDDFATAWLNVPKPVKHSAPEPADALVALEVHEALEAQSAQSYAGAKLNRNLAPAKRIQELVKARVLQDHGAGYQDGVRRLSVSYEFGQALAQHYPNAADKETRRGYIVRLRAELEISGEDKGFAPKWLKGPFTPEPKWVKEQADRKAEQERASASWKTLEAAMAALRGEVTAFEQAAPDLTTAEIQAQFTALLVKANAPAPWRPASRTDWNVDAFAANGAKIASHSDVCNRLQLIGLNIAAGVPAAEWPPSGTGSPPLTREAFERAMGVEFAQRKGGAMSTRCDEAKAALAAHLEEESVEFGDEDWDWTDEAARTLAQELLTEAEEMVA